mgnify:CR=1 FL=1
MAENGKQVTNIVCPMCGGNEFQPSWVGVVSFEGSDFTFMECVDCRSFICDPMPDEQMLLEMYGNSYFDGGVPELEDSSEGKFAEVLEHLRRAEPGVFIDYGCGGGDLLAAVAELGWRPIGIEFNPEQINELKRALPYAIVSHQEKPSELADVLHLGDVLEHLTEMDLQFPKILSLLKVGGVLIAHGPLEANPNVFNYALSLSRRIKGAKVTSVAPYHVILATSKGQRRLFERHGLREEAFKVKEVAFPAPESLNTTDLKSVRRTALYLIRKASQAATKLTGEGRHGNRYFYIGERSEIKNG